LGNIRYNFTAKVEQDFDEIAEGNVNWTEMMQEFYDKSTVKDVEANAEEKVEKDFRKDPKGKQVLVRLGKLVHGSNWWKG
jgi:DNA topoisomerase-1